MNLRQRATVVVVAAVVALGSATVASAAVSAEIAKKGDIIQGGAAVLVDVTVACSAGSEVLEAFVYVVQDGNTSQFAGLPVVCDGTAQTVTVRVPTLEMPFQTGKARASGYVLLTTGDSISFGARIKIRD